jgi:hypothetical protein
MRRREFIGVICGAALTRLSCAAAQQPGKVWRIGIVFTAERGEPDAKALEQSLAELGSAEGSNVVLLHRFVDPQPDKIEEAVGSLVPQIDLLVVRGSRERLAGPCARALSCSPLRGPRLGADLSGATLIFPGCRIHATVPRRDPKTAA